jgi:glycosyltransferase involved in cell wall biosynthesis
MVKVLVIANDFSTIFNFRLELIKKIREENFEVVLALPPSEKNEYFKEIGIKVLETPLERNGTNPIHDLALLRTYKRLVKTEMPDICLTYTVKPNIYGSIACKQYGIPYINNVTGLGSRFTRDDIVKKIIIILQKYAYKKSSCVFFQNRENLKYFLNKKIVHSDVAELIPGSGVNLDLHKFEDFPEEGPTRFITVARVRRDKGYCELFEAAQKIKSDCPDVEFHVVGAVEEGDFEETIKSLSENNIIIYHGEKTQEEVHELIKKSHCLIHPSYHEGMANVVLEASATGRPCLVSDISGCREAVEDGKTGLLFKPENSDELTETIIKFMSFGYEEHKRMGTLAHEKVAREFDRQIVIDSYIEKIDTVLYRRALVSEVI